MRNIRFAVNLLFVLDTGDFVVYPIMDVFDLFCDLGHLLEFFERVFGGTYNHFYCGQFLLRTCIVVELLCEFVLRDLTHPVVEVDSPNRDGPLLARVGRLREWFDLLRDITEPLQLLFR